MLEVLAAHFIAISTWIEGQRRLPSMPVELRLPFHLGAGVVMAGMMLAGTIAGYLLVAGVPALVTAALLFMTPLYFILSLIATSRSAMDMAAVGDRLRPEPGPLSRACRASTCWRPGWSAARSPTSSAGGADMMAALDDGFGGYLVLFAAGFLATEIWRWLGLLVGSRLDVAGEVFQWVRAVATALVAGMVDAHAAVSGRRARRHPARRAPRRRSPAASCATSRSSATWPSASPAAAALLVLAQLVSK